MKGNKTMNQLIDNRIPGKTKMIIFILLRLFLGGVFIYASIDKIMNPDAFAKAVYNYRIMPDNLVNMTALVLPWLELILGLCLITGILLPGASVTCTVLLTVFIGALAFNQIRGLDVHCGCFSTEASAGPASLWTVARDAGFLLASIVLTRWVFTVQPLPFNIWFQQKQRVIKN